MPNIKSTTIDQFQQLQLQIWEAVASSVTNVSSKPIRFIDPLTVSVTSNDISEELVGQKLVILFSFDSTPEQKQLLIFSPEILIGIAQLFKTEIISAATEELISEIQPIIDAIVQGICQVISEKKHESFTSSNIVARLEPFSLPENLEREDEMIRVTAAISCEELNGSITWLINEQCAELFLGNSQDSIEDNFSDGQRLIQQQGSFSSDESRSIDLLYDIPLEISVELGRVKMLIKDILELSNGSIIEIDKVAGEPVDIMVNGKTVAKGEVIVIDDNFGVRITEILNPKERLQKI